VRFCEHRAAAEHALTNAQRNPVLSTSESFLAAQAHALLAIERRLSELVDEHLACAPRNPQADLRPRSAP